MTQQSIPVSFVQSIELHADVCKEIDHWLAKFPADQKRSAVIAALSAAQHHYEGSLSRPVMDAVAKYLGLPFIAVYEVASFYSMYELEPVGRNMIAICNNISCMLTGADEIIEHIEKSLNIKIGETSADGRITLKREEECLAACAGGPMMAVNGHYHENLTKDSVDKILAELK